MFEVRIMKYFKVYEKVLKIIEGICMVFYVNMMEDFKMIIKIVCIYVEKLKLCVNCMIFVVMCI